MELLGYLIKIHYLGTLQVVTVKNDDNGLQFIEELKKVPEFSIEIEEVFSGIKKPAEKEDQQALKPENKG